MEPPLDTCLVGDCLAVLRTLPAGFVQTCVTSPPYFGLRDYGHPGQLGLEATPEAFVDKLVEVFREVRRVLKDDGTLWLNLGDSYASNSKGSGGTGKSTLGMTSEGRRISDAGILRSQKRQAMPVRQLDCGLAAKQLLGIPWRVAFALQADGWWLRQEIIWHKPNPMPESVSDRCTKAHEQIFLLSKAPNYFYDHEAIKEPAQTDDLRRPYGSPGANALDPRGRQGAGEQRRRPSVVRGGFGGKTADQPGREAFRAVRETRNKRSVWTVATKPYGGAHFAVFPTELVEPCVLAGSRPGDVVLDPFFGSGTSGVVAQALGRRFLGIEINEAYAPLQAQRLVQPSLLQGVA